MKHATLAELLEHLLNSTPLPCNCPVCQERVSQLADEKGFPSQVTEALPPSFWSHQRAKVEGVRSGINWLVPALAGAVMLLLCLAGAMIIQPDQPESSAVSTLTEKAQENLLLEIELLLEKPALDDLDLLVDENPSADNYSNLYPQGEHHEA